MFAGVESGSELLLPSQVPPSLLSGCQLSTVTEQPCALSLLEVSTEAIPGSAAGAQALLVAPTPAVTPAIPLVHSPTDDCRAATQDSVSCSHCRAPQHESLLVQVRSQSCEEQSCFP